MFNKSDFEGKYEHIFEIEVRDRNMMRMKTSEAEVEPYFKGTVFLRGISEWEGEVRASVGVLDVQYFNAENRFMPIGVCPAKFDMLSLTPEELTFTSEIDSNRHYSAFEFYDSLKDKFKKIHNDSPFLVTGKVYGDCVPGELTPVLDEKTWLAEDAHSIEDAVRWLLREHPDYYMGAFISQTCPSPDFSCLSVPSEYYGEGNFETIENRRECVKGIASEMGVQIGDFEYSLAPERESAAARLDRSIVSALEDSRFNDNRLFVHKDEDGYFYDLYDLKFNGRFVTINHNIIERDDVLEHYKDYSDASYAVYESTFRYPADSAQIRLGETKIEGDKEMFKDLLDGIIESGTVGFENEQDRANHIAVNCGVRLQEFKEER